MSAMVAEKNVSPELMELADEIGSKQSEELDTMTGWLETWGKPAASPPADQGHDDGLGVGRHTHVTAGDIPGMLSSESITAVSVADEGVFESMWVALMITHHEGAITMAKAQQADGEFAAATNLADSIVKTQTAEIKRLKALRE
jgi:uncharacterized protein (DUF305 family)